MNRIKLLAVFFSIGILFGCYFVKNNGFLSAKAQNIQAFDYQDTSAKLTQIKNKLNQKPTFQISKSDFNLFITILSNLKEQLNKILSNSIYQKANPAANNIPNTTSTSSALSLSSNTAINTINDYYENFIKLTKTISFTQSEAALMEKGVDGREILTLEELLQKAASGVDVIKLSNSFLSWSNLDQKIISSLKVMSVGGSALTLNNTLINWLQFHSDIAKKMSGGNLSASQIGDLYQQFKTKGAAQNLLMKNSIAQIKNKTNFSFINEAHAILSCPLSSNYYNFGGKILLTIYCNDGTEVMTVMTPCGGTLALTLAVSILNPYLNGSAIINSYVLGKASAVPGACTVGSASYTYDASVIYYGSSLPL